MGTIAEPRSQAPQPARATRRDSFRTTAAMTAAFSVALLLNVLWWVPSPQTALAPVIPAWLFEVGLISLLFVVGTSRSGHKPITWLTFLLQPLGVAMVTFSNMTMTPTVAAATIASAAASAGGAILLTVLAYRSAPSAPIETPQGKFADFRMLMKFRIISLLLLTTLVPMYVANDGEWPSLWKVLATLLGGTLAAGGANAINMYIDRDIDAVMSRTKRRPLPGNRLRSYEVLGFGIGLSVLAFLVLWPVNLLTAILALSGVFYYVVIYTMWLKRSTTQNIVIGGAAGAIPPLVGWAAGSDPAVLMSSPTAWLPAIFMFAIVFYWTPPHFWALAIVRREDYARAGVPMLPVVRGEGETRRQIVLYTLLMLALTLMLVALGTVGVVYLGQAVVLGLIFLYYALKMLKDHTHAAAWKLYKYSLLYLALLFVAMGIDRAILG